MKTIARTKRVAVITASAVVAFLALGCGQQKEQAVGTGTGIIERTSQAIVAAANTPTPEAGLAGEGFQAGSVDSLPPDVYKALDAFTLQHVLNNTASTSYPGIFGSYSLAPGFADFGDDCATGRFVQVRDNHDVPRRRQPFCRRTTDAARSPRNQ
jgi:hypothetical protein